MTLVLSYFVYERVFGTSYFDRPGLSPFSTTTTFRMSSSISQSVSPINCHLEVNFRRGHYSIDLQFLPKDKTRRSGMACHVIAY